MKLTDKACKAAKPEKKPYKLSDGGGLHLKIMSGGSKLWQMKCRYLGKENLLSFGAYPIVGLAEARRKREQAKKLLANDTDPSAIKRDQRKLEHFRFSC